MFFAPNTSYESDHEHHHEGRELKQLVRELHENGIEVILDVVFNHTAEGNEMGPYFSFKGIDNNIYYMLTRTESITISAVAAMFSTAISRLCSSLYLTVCVIG